MGKVQVINKSRKVNKCSKCGDEIPVGSKYLKGEINFGPTIIRCTKCGLQSWEVTTSEYLLAVCPIIYNWREDFGVSEETADEIVSVLEDIRDTEQDKFDNLPESLQYAPVGEAIQSRIDAVDDAISMLEDLDYESLQMAALEENEIDEDVGCSDEFLDEFGYSGAVEKLQVLQPDLAESLIDSYEEYIAEAIDEALSDLEV